MGFKDNFIYLKPPTFKGLILNSLANETSYYFWFCKCSKNSSFQGLKQVIYVLILNNPYLPTRYLADH